MSEHPSPPDAQPERSPESRPAWTPSQRLGRVLDAGALLSMATLAVGLALALLGGQRGGRGLRPADVLRDLAHGRGTGVIGVGIVALIATPLAREVAAMILFGRHREHALVAAGAVVLVLAAASIAIGLQ